MLCKIGGRRDEKGSYGKGGNEGDVIPAQLGDVAEIGCVHPPFANILLVAGVRELHAKQRIAPGMFLKQSAVGGAREIGRNAQPQRRAQGILPSGFEVRAEALVSFEQNGHVGENFLKILRQTCGLVPAIERRKAAFLFEFREEARSGVDRKHLPGGRFGERVAPCDAVDDSPERKVGFDGRHDRVAFQSESYRQV